MFISDNETAVDLLYYEAIAKTIVGLINESADEPMSIGIYGDWGTGKSSILLMTEKAFSGDSDILCLRFNGWQFQGFEDAKAALPEKIVIELHEECLQVQKRTSNRSALEGIKKLLLICDRAQNLQLSIYLVSNAS
jgi:predicted KAP-like P-loop ATPase